MHIANAKSALSHIVDEEMSGKISNQNASLGLESLFGAAYSIFHHKTRVSVVLMRLYGKIFASVSIRHRAFENTNEKCSCGNRKQIRIMFVAEILIESLVRFVIENPKNELKTVRRYCIELINFQT